MDLSFLNTITDFFKNLFETPLGVVVLFVVVIFLSLIVAAILEKRTKNKFVDHPKEDDSD